MNKKIKSITPNNLISITAPKNTLLDKMTQLLYNFLYPVNSNSLIDHAYYISNGIGFSDLPLIIVSIIQRYYMNFIVYLGLDFYAPTIQHKFSFEKLIDPEVFIPPSCNIPYIYDPIKDNNNLLTLQGMNWIINNIYIYDLLERTNDGYVIDTSFMDKFEYKKDMMKLGCIAHLSFDPKENMFIITSLHSVNYPNISEKLLYNLFFASMITHLTVCSHFYNVHYNINAQITYENQKLSLDHSVRQILLPTELFTLQVVARANELLVYKNYYGLDYFSAYTYSGIQNMISHYGKKRRNLNDVVKRFPEVHNLRIWNEYIMKYVIKAVDLIYPTEVDLRNDSAVIKWAMNIQQSESITKKDLISIISMVYGSNVQHILMSNPIMVTLLSLISVAVRYNHNQTYGEIYRILNVAVDTSQPWVDFTVDFSNIIHDSTLRILWHEFYQGMWLLKIDNRYPLLLPQNINQSTGL